MEEFKKSEVETNNQPARLKRELGLISAVNLILNLIIGAGIFITPGTVLAQSGSVGMSFVIWIACGVLSILGALVFAELGTVIPRSGGIYSFLLAAFKNTHPFFGPLLGYNFIFIQLLMVAPAATAIVAQLYSSYVYETIRPSLSNEFNKSYGQLIQSVLGIGGILCIVIVNYLSVKLFLKVQNLLTYLKVFGCLFIIVGGLFMLISGKALDIPMGFSGTNTSLKAITMSFYACLYSYDGWNLITGVTEEVKAPEKNILRCVLIAVPIVTFLFVVMNAAYLTALTASEVMNQSAIAVTFGDRVFGRGKVLITFCVAISALGNGFGMMFYSSRLCFAAAREGHMVKVFCYIHKTRLTPAPAVLLQGILGLIYFILGNSIISLIDFYNFLNWIFYGLSMIILFVLRSTMPDANRPYKVPLIIPAVVAIVAALLSIIPVVLEPSLNIIVAVVLIIIGTVLYYPLVYKKIRVPGVDKFSKFLESRMDIVPPANDLCIL